MAMNNSESTARQRVIAVIMILVLVIVIWQVVGLFKRGSKTAPPIPTDTPKSAAMSAHSANDPSSGGDPVQPAMGMPTAASLTPPPPPPQEQSDFVKLQQQLQERYVAALNELQMLKLASQIADTNKQIAAARLETAKSEKNLVNLLTKPAADTSFSSELVRPVSSSQGGAQVGGQVSYMVISVSELLHKWRAVLGYDNKLYSVGVGDVLPPDHSTVVAIDKQGIILEANGIQRRVSLVPTI
jgi:hypothetical protein